MNSYKLVSCDLLLVAAIVVCGFVVVFCEPTFRPCRGYNGPLGSIRISSCPGAAKENYCEIERNSNVSIWADIQTEKPFERATFRVTFSQIGCLYKTESNLTTVGGECPSKAGQEHHLSLIDLSSKPLPIGESTARLEIFNMDSMDRQMVMENTIYCAEFPARVEG